MTREEWINRYAKRIQECASWDEDSARNAAEIGADVFEQFERGAGNAIEWEDPEGFADDEMSYWEDDGE